MAIRGGARRGCSECDSGRSLVRFTRLPSCSLGSPGSSASKGLAKHLRKHGYDGVESAIGGLFVGEINHMVHINP
jgi:hypothetical protein